MNVLKKMAVSVFMSASLLAISTTTFAAESEKDLNTIVLAAANNTQASLLEAKSLLEKGGDTSEQIKNALNDARQSIKEFRYEQTERLRQKMNNKIKTAREAFIDNNNEKALADVNEALKIYAEMRQIYDAAH